MSVGNAAVCIFHNAIKRRWLQIPKWLGVCEKRVRRLLCHVRAIVQLDV